MAVSAAEVKRLRERTGAGPMECKKALEEANNDFDAAEKYLKEKGLAAVEKRAGRATNEGKVFVTVKGKEAVLVELASETDFVARNPDFIALGGLIADKALEKGFAEPNDELNGIVTELATKIRENMSLKRLRLVKAADNEYLSSYVHGDGAIGIVVKLAADNSDVFKKEEAEAFAMSLAMHIAAFNPMALDKGQIDPAFIKEQEEIFRKQMEDDESFKGKPAAMMSGILGGKLNKLIKSLSLMDQGYIKDEKITVSQAVDNCGKQLGTTLRVAEYVYFKVGQE